ncbi:MAG: carbohydrate kinase [Propionibacteriaceae bacterium]|nr:carbohydrate kinase [Propionibacteriaceae bacterium]
MPTAVVIGEALIDVFERPGSDRSEYPGGSPLNVAVGLGRLGRGVWLGTWIGTDARSMAIKAHCQASNVQLLPGADQAERTSTARAFIDDTGHADYSFDIDWETPQIPKSIDPLLVHVGSISAVFEPGAADLAELVQKLRTQATISYDPNIRPAIMDAPTVVTTKVERLVGLADIVKASDEDMEWLYPNVPLTCVVTQWLGLGAGIVVVTKGEAGVTAATANVPAIVLPGHAIPVVDTIGAGDAFMSGLLHAAWAAGLLGAENRTALRNISTDMLGQLLSTATGCAEIACSRPGADPPWLGKLGS